jgi:hypothetical protein
VNESVSGSRQELNELRKEYREESQQNLDKCFGYLNFYVGLLAAVLAATLTGLLRTSPGDARAWLLLAGPAVTLALGRLGYQTIAVFYRRYVEAWVTQVNLETMLAVGTAPASGDLGRPLVPSRSGGWLARFERPQVDQAMRAAANAESLVVEVTRLGDTLRYARRTMLVFVMLALAMSVACIIVATR